MDNDNNNNSTADARIVQTVRRLKSSKNNTIINKDIKRSILNEGQKTPQDLPQRDYKKQVTLNLSTLKSTKDSINLNNANSILNKTSSMNLNNVINPYNNEGRIIIDVNKQSSLNEKGTHQPYDYYNLRRIKKTKTEYQKNILSDVNISKYKAECLNLIKGDNELKGMFKKIGINKDNAYNNYIEENLFNKEYFLFELEILIVNDIQESNTLKVFSVNKKKLPFKQAKEQFYKNHIKRMLNRKINQDDYKDKINSLIEKIDNHISNLNNFEL